MKRFVCAAFLVSFMPASALAQFYEREDDIRYSWFGVGYSAIEIDAPGEDVDAGGWAFDVSFAVHEYLHLFGEYQGFELDDFESAEGHEKTFGIGTHFSFGKKVSLFGRVGWIDVAADDADDMVVRVEDDGYRVTAGARFMPWTGYEIRGGVDYIDLDLSGDDIGGFIGGDVWLTPAIALVGEYRYRDDDNRVNVGARLYFGE